MAVETITIDSYEQNNSMIAMESEQLKSRENFHNASPF